MAGQVVRTQALVRGPAQVGVYTIRFDLVQRVGGELRALSVASVEQEIEVEHAAATSSRLRDELERRAKDPTRTRPARGAAPNQGER